MDFNKAITDFLKYWILPKGFQVVLSNFVYSMREKAALNDYSNLLKNNVKFKNIHKGERCFIIANGPSIKTQDLKLLKDEICLSVNNGFVHPDYEIYNPLYHCLPQIEDQYSENKIKWLIEMDKGILNAHLFTSVGNKKDIEDNDLFKNRANYIYFKGDINSLKEIDLTKNVPPIRTVPHICILVAIYMGFEQIYLLGCDHDWVLHFGKSTHFYKEGEHILKEVWPTGQFEEYLKRTLLNWNWYNKIKLYSEEHNIEIYNATKGGLLDVFPRIEYESIF